MAKVVFITGASAGIGQSTALHLQKQGYRVFGASRSGRADGVKNMLTMDVNSDEAVQTALHAVMQQAGRIDVLVNCAGFGIAGAIEDTSMEEAKAQFDTNFFGTARVCRQVLPFMRQQQEGLIINVSSLGGLAAIPFQGYYSASKFAIEGFSEALRMEVKPFGIHVAMVEPGDFATGFTDSRRLAAAAPGSPYAERFRTALSVMERDERGGPDPVAVAACIAGIIRRSAPGLRHPVGLRGQTLGVALKRVLPYALFEDGVLRHFGLR